MSEIQVEVRFTDKLKSIRVGGQDMEIPNAIKTKSVEEWFEPAAGRVNWDGLGAEIKAMGFSGEKDAVYSFQFNGPEDKKREFMNCVECFCLGEEAQQETQEETEQDYLQDASDFQQVGNAEMAFQKYMVAASDYGSPEAQFEVARCYQNGTGVEKMKKMRSCGTKRPQSRDMRKRRKNWATAITMEQVLQKIWNRHLNATARRQNRAMQERRTIWAFAI